MFNMRSGLKEEWIDTDLLDNTAGWRSEWFYIVNQLPGLPRRTGHKPVKINKWDLGLSSEGPKQQTREGGSEWEPIKILFKNSSYEPDFTHATPQASLAKSTQPLKCYWT
jgi:hypothetical protein